MEVIEQGHASQSLFEQSGGMGIPKLNGGIRSLKSDQRKKGGKMTTGPSAL